MRTLFFGVIVVSLAASSMDVRAQTGWGAGSWQAIGATGTPDESALRAVVLRNSGWAEIHPQIKAASVTLRYNIPPVEGLRGSAQHFYLGYTLRAYIRDNGPAAQVLVSIKAVPWGDGQVRTLAQLDSNAGLPTSESGAEAWGPFLQDETGFMKYFRPFHTAYWAEVRLIKTAREGRPGIRAVGVLIDET